MATPTVALTAPASTRIELFGPLVRAGLWGIAAYGLGALATALLLGGSPTGERAITVGYVAGVIGWILGGGAWEGWVRPWFGGAKTWDEGTGLARYLRFSTDHKVIGLQYLWAAGLAFLLAGLIAMAIRLELITPAVDVFGTAQTYTSFVGVHGALMIFAVAVVAIIGGFGNYFVPLLVGAEDMTFPSLNGVSWWLVVPGIVAILASPLLGGFQTGWTGYAPLAAASPPGQTLYYLGILSLGLSSLLTAFNIIATTIYLRAPGLTWGRLPMFSWAMLFTAVLTVLWLPVVTVAMLLGLLDRIVPTDIFGASGLPLLWQDLFWLFGHPEVYIIMLGAWGIWLEVIPVFARKTLFGYRWALAGFLGITFLSGAVWVHHMFATVGNVRLIPFMSTTELISIPTGFMYLVAIGTLWQGRIRLTTPMLLVLFSMLNFLIGGATGVFLADVPSDLQLTDTFFVVGHFHYTIVGGMIFAWLGALFYWFPKFSGRMYSERWGRIGAWWLLISFNLTFLPMFASGIEGMNRRVASYLPYLQDLNVLTSIGGLLFGIGFVIPLVNLTWSWLRGPRAVADPWAGKTLEWRTDSPPPRENFHTEPVVTADFYGYGRVAPEPPLFAAGRPQPEPAEGGRS